MMSKNNEHYPGTIDRVSLITGTKEAISDVVQLLVKKMKERQQELNDSDTRDWEHLVAPALATTRRNTQNH